MVIDDNLENPNPYRIVLDELGHLFKNILKSLCNGNEIIFKIDETSNERYGDLTCNIAFLLTKILKKPPPQIATELVNDHIIPYMKSKKDSFIISAEAHQSGYINFRIDYNKIFDLIINKTLFSEEYKYQDIGNKKFIIIEHTSVNPNKAIHIGHLRNIILGDSLYRIFKNTNHDVKVLNYIDDSGVQVADIVVAFLYAGFPETPSDPETKYDHYCGDVYVKVTNMMEQDKLLLEKRKIVIREIEIGDSKIAVYSSNLVKKILKEQLKTCAEMRSRYDLLNIESDMIKSKLWEKSFQILKDKNIIYFAKEGKNVNCWVIKPADDEDEKVIVRSDGTVTYFAKDIPYALWKLQIIDDPFDYEEYEKQWDGSKIWMTTINKNKLLKSYYEKKFFENKPAKVITIIDSRQARLQNLIISIIKKIKPDYNNYYYLGYEAVTLSPLTSKILGFEPEKNIVHMSGRKGLFVNADILIDQLKTKLVQEIEKRNQNQTMHPDEINKIAQGIAVSTIRYSLIKQDLDKIIVFDINEATNLDGDTSLYLQYAYARAHRILEKSNITDDELIRLAKLYSEKRIQIYSSDIEVIFQNDRGFPLDNLNFRIEEINLIKDLAKFDQIIEQTLETLNPKVLARYANSIATKFNLFYESVPVLKETDQNLRNERLFLVKSFIIILNNVFDLIGIVPLSKI